MSTAKQDKILMVDDEPNVLSGYQRTVGRTHALTVAEGGAAALAVMKTGGPFAVVITDMRMPDLSGLAFIEAARPTAKETVFMMLTGNADQQTAVDAINRGHIFRFLNKPCAPEQLDSAIRAGIRQYELVTAERVLLRETLTGSIKLLGEALEMANPYLASIQNTVKQVHQDLCTSLGITRDWQMVVASSLCLIGLVTVPGLKKDAAVSDEALELAAELGHRLIANLPRMSPVAEMIRHQRQRGPLPSDLKSTAPGTAEMIGARLLRICVDVAREQRKTGSLLTAIDGLAASAGYYDHRLIAALGTTARSVAAVDGQVAQILVEDLEAGMELDENVVGSDGMLVLSKGQQLSDISVAGLRSFAKRGAIAKTVRVRTRSPQAKAA